MKHFALMIAFLATLFTLIKAGVAAQAKAPDQWAIENAQIGPASPIEIPVGGSYTAQVMYPVPDGPLYPLKADVMWWIEPAVKGIFIEAKSGRITVADSVPHGTTATVYADVPGRKQKVSAKILVFSPKQNPIVGAWRVQSISQCGSQAAQLPAAAASPLAEYLWRFGADQQFFIGHPSGIAARLAQSGTYHYDVKAARLKLKPSWPKDAVESDWKIAGEAEQGTLDLKSSKKQSGHGTACGYVLASAEKAN
jgi:hypothetical protein